MASMASGAVIVPSSVQRPARKQLIRLARYGATSRDHSEPTQESKEELTMATLEQPKVRRAGHWFDVRHRKLGMWAYALNRISGIGLVVYLYLHLVVLSTL